MRTGWQTTHKHTVSGRPTTATGGHSHDLAAVEDALAAVEDALAAEAAEVSALAARITALEAFPTPAPTPDPARPWPTLQAAIDATPAGGIVDGTGRVFVAGATIRRPLILRGGTLHVASGDGITVLSPDVILDGVTLIGNAGAGAMGIRAVGADALVIRRCIIRDWGYAGIMILETPGALVEDTRVENVGVGVTGATNAYGIAVSNLGGAQSSDVTVQRCAVDHVPNWHGLDTHAGLRVRFIANSVGRCNRAIFVTSDSHGRPSSDVEVSGNTCHSPTPRADVLDTRPWNEVGITVVTGSVNVRGTSNVLDGWPAGNAIDVQGSGAVFTGSVVTHPV